MGLYERTILTEDGKPLKRDRPEIFVDIENVAKYFYEDSPKENWLFTDFPNCAPPANHIWFEWKPPAFSNNEGRLIPNGFAATCRRIATLIDYRKAAFTFFNGWTAVATIVIESRSGEIQVPVSIPLKISKEGCVEGLTKPGSKGIGVTFLNTESGRRAGDLAKIDNGICDLYITLLKVSLLALSYMHCKNVRLIDDKGRTPRPGKDGYHPLYQYKNLVIDPLKPSGRYARSRKQEPQFHLSLHICRGHFSKYSEDKPLFGKYVGTFWIPSHLRGRAEIGIVEKEYYLRLGSQAAAV